MKKTGKENFNYQKKVMEINIKWKKKNYQENCKLQWYYTNAHW